MVNKRRPSSLGSCKSHRLHLSGVSTLHALSLACISVVALSLARSVHAHEVGVDSVLLVTEQDFDTCNTRSPVRRLQAAVGNGSGSSVLSRLDRSGPFYFISSDEGRCQKGQKLYIIVMVVRGPTPPPAPAVAPAPGSASSFPPAPSPAWASTPESENAHAPPPTAGASRLVIDEAFIGSVVGVIGAAAWPSMW